MINSISSEMIESIKRKTAYNLPDNPSAQGMKAPDIKKAFYQSQTDSTNSILAALNEVIQQANIDIAESQSSVSTHEAKKDNPHNVTKEQIGLGQVDNTSDAHKPISTATQIAINNQSHSLKSHTSNLNNPHNVTKEQLGLGACDNTSDADKPISTATQTALAQKVNITDIVDSLDSEEKLKPLSARQGKLLKDAFDGLPKSFISNIDIEYLASSGVLTILLKDENNNTITEKSVDLPLELVLAPSGSYYDNGALFLKLANNQFVEIDVNDMLSTLAADGSSISISNNIISVSTTYKNKINDAYNAKHSHGNHTLLETYTQTEESLSNAVNKAHNHNNTSILDNTTASFTQQHLSTLNNLSLNGLPRTETITIAPSAWNSNKQCVKNSQHVKTHNIVIVSPAPAYYDAFIAAGVRALVQSDGSITFECQEKPLTSIDVQLTVWG